MNEEVQRKVEPQSEQERKLKEIIDKYNGKVSPAISTAYVTLQVIKGEIQAETVENTTATTYKITKSGKAYATPRVPYKESRGSTRGGIDIEYYRETIRRILREHRGLIHPRTHDFIPTCTNDDNPEPYHSPNRLLHIQLYKVEDGKLKPTGTTEGVPYGHLGAFPTVTHHRLVNAVQVSGKWVVKPRENKERCNPTDIQKLQYESQGEVYYKATAQYKTVWYTRRQRRK